MCVSTAVLATLSHHSEGSYATEQPTPTMGAGALVVDTHTPTAVAVSAVGGGCDAPHTVSCRSALAVVGLLWLVGVVPL